VKRVILIFILTSMLLPIYAKADSPALCARQYFTQLTKEGPTLGFSQSQAEITVARVARSIAFQQKVTVIYCERVLRALAWAAKSQDGIPDGDFIEVNPVWLREVIGNDETQAIALLGHELGHFLGRHFESRASIPQEQKEAEADQFAGCAVARLSGNWSALENLLSRIRTESGGNGYPSRAESLRAARQGYDDCGGNTPKTPATRASLRVAAEPDTVGISVGGFRAVDYAFKETKGIEVQIDSEDTQWFFLNGDAMTPVERFGRILGGSFPVPASGSETYHNNIFLPERIATAAKAKGQNVVQLKHTFNCRDANNNVFQVTAVLRIFVQ
jgi:hypothetical protein